MLAYLPKVVAIESLTQCLRAKHLRFSATIPTFPQSLQGPSLKYALIRLWVFASISKTMLKGASRPSC